jgi:hypothetical protein
MAKESQNVNDIFTAVKQVVNNCCMDNKVNIDKLPLYELEYAFLRLRMQSINNMVELSFHDNEDNQDYKFVVDLDTVQIKYPEPADNKIEVGTNGVGIILRHPPAALYSNENFLNAQGIPESFDEILFASIDQIYDEETVYEPAQSTREELEEFLESVDSSSYKKVQKFFESTPYMEHIIKYKNKNGTERTINLRSLSDFFIL